MKTDLNSIHQRVTKELAQADSLTCLGSLMSDYDDKKCKKTCCFLLVQYAIEADERNIFNLAVSQLCALSNQPVLESYPMTYPKYLLELNPYAGKSLLSHVIDAQQRVTHRLAIWEMVSKHRLIIDASDDSEISQLMGSLSAFWTELADCHQSVLLKYYDRLPSSLTPKQREDIGSWFYDFTHLDSFSSISDYVDDEDELYDFDDLSHDLPQTDLELTMFLLWSSVFNKKHHSVEYEHELQVEDVKRYFSKYFNHRLSLGQIAECINDPMANQDLRNKLAGFDGVDNDHDLQEFFSKHADSNDFSWRSIACFYHQLIESDYDNRGLTEEEFVNVLCHGNAKHNYLDAA